MILYKTILHGMEVDNIKTYGGFLISQIKQLQGRVFEKMLKESGIDAFNGAQGRILYVLWENEKLTISEIGHLTSLAKTTLTSMLDRLEESGLVVRTADPKNRRQVYVSITEKARLYKEEYDKVTDRMNELFYRGFSENEVIEFENMLRKIITNIE